MIASGRGLNTMFEAVGKNIFVEEQKQEERIGALLIPDSLDSDLVYGKIITCGEYYYENGVRIDSQFKVGDVICFPKIVGAKLTLNGKKLIKVSVSDVVAKQVGGE